MRGVDHRDEPIRRGPVTYRFNGRGVRPWLPAVIVGPGRVDVVTTLATLSTSQGHPRRVCWRCVPGLRST